ncbi:symmetrical bis(5'-nucleosyl)-tetraphosphatase [Thiomicrorhabdus aquaedulcis]|uniref:symmetrical bis(5'-nucleosyl)-tetraphosphatase n=1 Tax=Thiomicrorhabdus aquaedulcis TaxID=2211106 RepID=UPI000FD9E416|nr:symmetrical bis(5'-nucleosyl)-tetraphosphatase [Thiomicrorhabdus aquaedulcis]
MTTYVIGDLQGCFDELQALLKHIQYQPEADVLWFVGDIVNRGPQSLACLRFVKTLQQQGKAAMVLGNHDFHLLATYAGLTKFANASDTLDDILNAPDVQELMDWLRQQPLLIRHPVFNAVMVHAGIAPQWSVEQAQQHAKSVEACLRAPNWQEFLTNELFSGNTKLPNQWHDALSHTDKMRYIVNVFARMRYCDAQGKLDYELKAAPKARINLPDATQPSSEDNAMVPWFVLPGRKNKTVEIFFGHWSTLGALDAYHVHSTDTGCLWGGQLTAYAIDTKTRHTLNCQQRLKPKLPKASKVPKLKAKNTLKSNAKLNAKKDSRYGK